MLNKRILWVKQALKDLLEEGGGRFKMILDKAKIELVCVTIGCSKPHGEDCKLFKKCCTLERLAKQGYIKRS